MKKLLALAIACVMALGTACGNNTASQNPPASQSAEASQPAQSQAATQQASTAPATSQAPASQAAVTTPGQAPEHLSFTQEVDIVKLDPHFSNSSADITINANIFDGLINVDTQGNVYPLVAESYNISDDGKVYTFNLRHGVKFHNGKDLDASDVLYSLQRCVDSPYMALFTPYISKFEAPDDYTVVITLHEPAAPFISQFAAWFAVLDEETTTAAGDAFADHPIGCGAYEFVSKAAGVGVELKAFKDYYMGEPAVKTVSFKTITDGSTALIALENGEIDYCTFIPPASINLVKSNPKLAFYATDTPNIAYLSLNVTKAPLDNPKLRQAIGYALDRESMIEVAREGLGTPALSLINETYIGYTQALGDYGFNYDPDKAAELLAEAGYPEGKGLAPIKLNTLEPFKKDAEMIQASLMDLGIQVEINLVEINAFVQLAAAGDMDMGYISIGLGNDATVMNILIDKGAAYNFAMYENAEVSAVWVDAIREMDVAKRSVLLEKALMMVKDDAPYIPAYFRQIPICTQANIDPSEYMKFLVSKITSIQFR